MTGQVLVEKQPLLLRSSPVPRLPPLLLQCRPLSNEQPPRALELRLQQHLHLHNTHHVRAVAVPRARLNPTANLRLREFLPLLLGRNFTSGSSPLPFPFSFLSITLGFLPLPSSSFVVFICMACWLVAVNCAFQLSKTNQCLNQTVLAALEARLE